jgi:uncharacterized membrane protein YgdD (TMEM256/DUF423 family)
MNHRLPVLAAGLLGATGVAAGAFGAHGLRPYLVQMGTLEVWQTAVHYQLAHAIALLALGAWMRGEPFPEGARAARWTLWLWTVGVGLFSGSLYLLATGAPHWVGPITPLGGASLIGGWVSLAAAAWPRRDPR